MSQRFAAMAIGTWIVTSWMLTLTSPSCWVCADAGPAPASPIEQTVAAVTSILRVRLLRWVMTSPP
jgi:hypothetical protein